MYKQLVHHAKAFDKLLCLTVDKGMELQVGVEMHCSMCHGKDGSGNGIVMEYGWFKPKAYWDDQVLAHKDGKLFDIITNGIRTMSGYGQEIPENDRWAIVFYFGALHV